MLNNDLERKQKNVLQSLGELIIKGIYIYIYILNVENFRYRKFQSARFSPKKIKEELHTRVTLREQC